MHGPNTENNQPKRNLKQIFGIETDHTKESEKEFEDFDLEVLGTVKLLLGLDTSKDAKDESLLDIIANTRKEIHLLGEDTNDLDKVSDPLEEGRKTLKLVKGRIGGKIFKYLFLVEVAKKFNNLGSIVGDSSTKIQPEEIVPLIDSTKNEEEIGHLIMDTLENLFQKQNSSLELKTVIQQILSDVYAMEPNALLHDFIMSLEVDEAVNQIFEDAMTK